MAQLIVRNLEPSVKARLQRRARRHGRSMEQEARDILTDAVRQDSESRGGLGTEIAALFAEVGLEVDTEEMRGHTLVPPRFRS